MNIVGDGFHPEINKQVTQRQKIYGSGYITRARSSEEILYLNANTSWCKLVSSVDISDINKILNSSLKGITDVNLNGNALARQFVLFNGTKNQDQNQRAGIDTFKSPLGNNFAYGIGGTDFGLRPMMGIQSANIKHENRGSIRRATVKIKAFNKIQFDIIDILYLRLGFDVLLEWGHTMWYDNDGRFHNGGDIDLSLAESFLSGQGEKEVTNISTTTPPPQSNNAQPGRVENNNLFPSLPPQNTSSGGSVTTVSTKTIIGPLTYLDFLELIKKQRIKSCGNYDAMFAKVTNFHWSFNKDGSYDIALDLVSVGDVVESFKINLLNDSYIANVSLDSSGKPLKELSDENIAAYFSNQNSIASWFSSLINTPMPSLKPITK